MWLPTSVDVVVRADGKVLSYTRDAAKLTVSLHAKVSAAKARRSARRLMHAPRGAKVRIQQLGLREFRGGRQKLVWVVSLTPGRTLKHAIPAPIVVWIDARTGKPT